MLLLSVLRSIEILPSLLVEEEALVTVVEDKGGANTYTQRIFKIHRNCNLSSILKRINCLVLSDIIITPNP